MTYFGNTQTFVCVSLQRQQKSRIYSILTIRSTIQLQQVDISALGIARQHCLLNLHVVKIKSNLSVFHNAVVEHLNL